VRCTCNGHALGEESGIASWLLRPLIVCAKKLNLGIQLHIQRFPELLVKNSGTCQCAIAFDGCDTLHLMDVWM
jgi:hypothetical protein